MQSVTNLFGDLQTKSYEVSEKKQVTLHWRNQKELHEGSIICILQHTWNTVHFKDGLNREINGQLVVIHKSWYFCVNETTSGQVKYSRVKDNGT